MHRRVSNAARCLLSLRQSSQAISTSCSATLISALIRSKRLHWLPKRIRYVNFVYSCILSIPAGHRRPILQILLEQQSSHDHDFVCQQTCTRTTTYGVAELRLSSAIASTLWWWWWCDLNLAVVRFSTLHQPLLEQSAIVAMNQQMWKWDFVVNVDSINII